MDKPVALPKRASGILLHPTSLAGRHGIGDLGQPAYRFANFLAACDQSFWQVLPLGPPAYGNSPYQCLSSMAGNPLLVSLEILVEEGWLSQSDLKGAPRFPEGIVDFGKVIPFKQNLLKKAARNFAREASGSGESAFEEFCLSKKNWLDLFAEFMALKDANGGAAWTEWKRRSHPDSPDVYAHKFIQFKFFEQWHSLRNYCHDRGIEIIGDVPIFVAHDSVDVWANPEVFDLDKDGNQRAVAGVPPDYFSATGQLWGNPLYRWDVLARNNYAWWTERVRAAFELVDVVRLDHFRGFEKYYAVPAAATTAIDGKWLPGPGSALFEALEESLGALRIIAEDLGFITPEVERLREQFGFPGMRVLQFAFGNDSQADKFKPYNYEKNCVVYTGTHDNDTAVGWFASSGARDSTRTADQIRAERQFALDYLNSDGRQIHWDFIRAALSSVANTAIIPLQDVLGLGSEARMNLPASIGNNWTWRIQKEQLKPEMGERLLKMTKIYGRSREKRETGKQIFATD
ncbi:MAG TPA: 4-alpha-glucanotransferase [Acidobacteriota bacterium]|nr:4-alpha-glucanotransferase [Acidobacteriota bacterium]